jgi:hypothetical protein
MIHVPVKMIADNPPGQFTMTRSRSSLVRDDVLPFNKARAFARSLGLSDRTQWTQWLAGERPYLPSLPDGVPIMPHKSYPAEWAGWDDWLFKGREPLTPLDYVVGRRAKFPLVSISTPRLQ